MYTTRIDDGCRVYLSCIAEIRRFLWLVIFGNGVTLPRLERLFKVPVLQFTLYRFVNIIISVK